MLEVQIQNISMNPTVVCNGQVVTLLHSVWSMPTDCPCCGSLVITFKDQVSHFCSNDKCPDRVFAQLEHAVKKQSLDLDGCGESAIRLLMTHGVKDLSGLFGIQDVSFLGSAASRRFIAAREKAKLAPLWRKIHAFGIDGVGITTSKELAVRWPSVPDIMDAPESDLVALIGPVAAANLTQYLTQHVDDLERLIQAGVTLSEERKSGSLSGQVFCITGGLTTGSREEVQQKIEDHGGSTKSSVSKKVQFLVVGFGAGNNKSEAAAKYGTKCITETELYAMMGEPMVEAEIPNTDNL